jgi:TolB-like protein
MPPFPASPEKGGVGPWVKFCAEVIWWMVTAAWLVLARLPRWIRVVLSVWLVFMLISTCQRDSDSRREPKSRAKPESTGADIDRVANAAGEQIASAIEKSAKGNDWGKVGEEIGRRFGQVIGRAAAAGKILVAAPFPRDVEDAAATQFAQTVFSSCYGQLVTTRRNDVTVSPELPAGDSDSAFAALGQQLQVKFVLGARLIKNADGSRALAVRLVESETGAVTWSADFPATGSDPTDAAKKVAEAVLPLLPAKK